ncbi:MAG TPA: proteasome activator, partial [Acidimicrobiales bacterium]|nr:proteasome activator [Acidimicrobiales bacterium]
MSLTDDPNADPQPSSDGGPTASPQVEHPEVVPPVDDRDQPSEAVEQPAKVMRIGSMIKLLLEEVRQSELDEQSRDRLREIYETSIT